jgi:hypothetical protein
MTLPDTDRTVTPSPESPHDFDREFVEEFEAIAESLAALDARYRQIQRDRQQREQIQAEMQAIATSGRSTGRSTGRSSNRATSNDRDELLKVRDRLEQLELNLESSLFSWTGLREPVWFGLRYGGLGLILGWLLHACTQ